MSRILYLIIIAFFPLTLTANNLQITNVTFDGASEVTFDISWENSWRGPGTNPQFHDAAWVFIKVAPNGSAQWSHVTMDVTDSGPFEVITPTDLMGAFIRRGSQGTGTVTGTVSFDINGNLGLYPDIKVFGIEMVYVPIGPFYIGDGVSENRFHVGNDTTQPYLVDDSGIITYGLGPDDIFTSSIIATADFPSTFPNGYNPFYCMKYEISQSQYAEFLNCLTLPQQESRTATTISGLDFTNTYVMTNTSEVSNRNAIRCLTPSNGDPLYFFCDLDGDGIPNETNDGMDLAMNYLSYDDLKAYLDWAALRPMSLFQYEKACRGPLQAVPGEFAWGTPTFTAPGTLVNVGQSSETFSNIGATGVFGDPPNNFSRCGFAATSTSTRLTSGASYYGIMELTANVNERVCLNRFELEDEFGDGQLTSDGFSDAFELAFTSKGIDLIAVPASVSWLNSSFGTVGTARGFSTGGRGVR